MTKLHAHFDGQVLIPDEPVDLPQGCTLEVTVLEPLPMIPAQQDAPIIRLADTHVADDEL